MKTFLPEHVSIKHLDTPRIYAKNIHEANLVCQNDNLVIGELIEEGYIELKDDINLN